MASHPDRTAERRRPPSRSRQHVRPAHRAAAVGADIHGNSGKTLDALEVARELQRVGPPQPGRPLPVPPDQRDMALLRVRRLPKATRNVLAQVAVMSRPSTHVLDVAALAPAERTGMVHVLPNGLVDFAHPLFGSALYASLPETDRRAIHREVAARVPAQRSGPGIWPLQRPAPTRRSRRRWTARRRR